MLCSTFCFDPGPMGLGPVSPLWYSTAQVTRTSMFARRIHSLYVIYSALPQEAFLPPTPAHPGALARTLRRQPAGVAQHFPVQGGLCAPLGCVLFHQLRELRVDRLEEMSGGWVKSMWQQQPMWPPSLALCPSGALGHSGIGTTGTQGFHLPLSGCQQTGDSHLQASREPVVGAEHKVLREKLGHWHWPR